MKILLSQIFNSREAFQRIMKGQFSPKVSYWVLKNARNIEPELKSCEDVRGKLITEKYGVESSPGQWEVPKQSESEKLYYSELFELLSTEAEIEIHKIKLPEEYKISAEDVSLLEWMLDFEDEDKAKEEK